MTITLTMPEWLLWVFVALLAVTSVCELVVLFMKIKVARLEKQLKELP